MRTRAVVLQGGFLLAALLSSAAGAATWYVEKDGSGDFTTIQPAIDAAAPGDTIQIGPGRYTEYAPYDFGALTEETCVVVDKPNLTIRGVDRDAVIIGPETYEWSSGFEPNGVQSAAWAPGLVLESLTVQNLPNGIGLGASATVRDCTIIGCYSASPIFAAEAPRFEGCRVADSRFRGVSYWAGSTGAVVTGCELDGVVSGVIFSAAQDVLLEDSVFLNSASAQMQSGSWGAVRRCQFEGGTIVFLDSDGTVEDTFVERNPLVCLDVASGNVTATRNVF
jgi:hypothetical protein